MRQTQCSPGTAHPGKDPPPHAYWLLAGNGPGSIGGASLLRERPDGSQLQVGLQNSEVPEARAGVCNYGPSHHNVNSLRALQFGLLRLPTSFTP